MCTIITQLSIQNAQGSRDKRVSSAEVFIVVHSATVPSEGKNGGS